MIMKIAKRMYNYINDNYINKKLNDNSKKYISCEKE